MRRPMILAAALAVGVSLAGCADFGTNLQNVTNDANQAAQDVPVVAKDAGTIVSSVVALGLSVLKPIQDVVAAASVL